MANNSLTAVSRQPTAVTVPATSVELPQLVDAEAAARAAIETYKGFANTIDNDDTYRFVGEELVRVKGQRNRFERDCAALKGPYQESKRVAQNGMNVVDNYFAGVIKSLSIAERLLKDERERWEAVEKRRLQDEARQLAASQEEERQRVAEENRKRSEAAAAEARKKQEEAEKLARKRGAESKARAAQLQQEAERVIVDAHAQNEMATEIAEISTSTKVSTATLTKTAGVSSRARLTAEFTDVREVLQGLVDGRIPMKAMRCKVDGKVQPLNGNVRDASVIEIPLDWFRREAADLGDAFNYPGVRAFEETNTAVRA